MLRPLLFVVVAWIVTVNCQESGSGDDTTEEPAERCSDNYSFQVARIRPPMKGGATAIVQNALYGFSDLRQMNNNRTGGDWRVVCGDDHAIHAVITAFDINSSDKIILNRLQYQGSGTCDSSPPILHLSKRRETLRVILKTNNSQTALKVYYICTAVSESFDYQKFSSTLLSCKPVLKYALENNVFYKLAQMILNRQLVTLAYRDEHRCTMLYYANKYCGVKYVYCVPQSFIA